MGIIINDIKNNLKKRIDKLKNNLEKEKESEMKKNNDKDNSQINNDSKLFAGTIFEKPDDFSKFVKERTLEELSFIILLISLYLIENKNPNDVYSSLENMGYEKEEIGILMETIVAQGSILSQCNNRILKKNDLVVPDGQTIQ